MADVRTPQRGLYHSSLVVSYPLDVGDADANAVGDADAGAHSGGTALAAAGAVAGGRAGAARPAGASAGSPTPAAVAALARQRTNRRPTMTL